ncbi:hypothetical protein [Pandoraea sputorum]
MQRAHDYIVIAIQWMTDDDYIAKQAVPFTSKGSIWPRGERSETHS